MNKNIVIQHFGGAPALAARLGYKHRNVCYQWPDVLTDRIFDDVIRRMKAARIAVPEEWKTAAGRKV